jgi:hypothetical protein
MKYWIIIALGLIGFSCKTSKNTAKSSNESLFSVREEKIDCFEAGLKADTSLIYCETSGVVFYNGKLYLAADKSFGKLPAYQPVWVMPYKEAFPNQACTSLQNPAFKKAEKYEDFTITSDKKFILLTTAFDRYRADHVWDGYNTLLGWIAGKEDNPFIISDENETKSSASYRTGIQKALTSDKFPDGPPYFKIEGLAALPDNKLIFGVREVGKSYADFEYVCKFVEVSYQITPTGKISLQNDFKLTYTFLPEKTSEVSQTLGLSSIEYDTYNQRLYLLTTYESGTEESSKTQGAYLWTLSLADMQKQAKPQLVRKPDGMPLHLSHKYEDLTIIDQNTIFLIADEDRVKPEISGKAPHQTWCAILKKK